MAKCTICNSRKGKRKCKATETFICSQCCGESRSPEKCEGCSFFKNASDNRNYRKLPYYTIQEMADSPKKEQIAMVIETSLHDVWMANKQNVNDMTALRLVEMLLDKYYFNDSEPRSDDPALAAGYELLAERIGEELAQVPAEQQVKALGAIYRSIQRRSVGGCSYLHFISRFT